jgi:hypothetical protein
MGAHQDREINRLDAPRWTVRQALAASLLLMIPTVAVKSRG